MTPTARRHLALVPLALQFVAMLSAVGIISFCGSLVASFAKKHENVLAMQNPTRLLIQNQTAAAAIVVVLFGLSVISVFVTRARLKDEADQLAVQATVLGVVWYVGSGYVGAVLMAAALPFFSLAHP